MASLIPGFEYDIFISYRQKDNKGDRWVSEFVDALKTELESTFKEEISVYFDINPHDGLLETHDVDASLKEKLKCLVFIPIISRTYCDPKSFAWEHEFKAFLELASQDRFGLMVKLPNGNVASRVLPVKIHELDNDDIKLCEAVLGGVLRGVEFIYKEPGVNRPLTQDDDEKLNLNKTKYRNQINKVANAIDENIRSLRRVQILPEEGKNQNKKPLKEVKREEKNKILKTKTGGREEIRTSSAHKIFTLKKWGIRIALILAALLIPCIWFAWPFLSNPKIISKNYESSVAVMIFEDLSDVLGFENFASGTTNDLISRLSRIQNLKVATITESLRFKQHKSLTRAICKDLGVKLVLQGSLKVEGENVTLTAELVDGEKDMAIWQQSKVGKLEKILDIQDEIVRGVVRAINVKYSSRQVQKQVGRRPTKNFRAYEFFLKGDEELTKWTFEGMTKALTFYDKALQFDQNFPDAYSHAALANLAITFFGYVNDNKVIESTKTYAKKALSFETDNEIALMSLEGYYMMKMLSGKSLRITEYRDLIVKLKSLISKNPSSPMGFFGLAEYFRLLKKDLGHASDYYKRALTQCERVLQSDTSNGIILGIAAQSSGMLGQLEYKAGHFKEAIKYTEQSIQLMPGIARTYSQLSDFYFETDQPQRARDILDEALSKVINPSDRGDIGLSQGRYSLIEGNFREAERYWANAMVNFADPSNPIYDYAFLYRYVILLRLGDSMAADSLLAIRLKTPDRNPWPEPLIHFFAGTKTEEDILKQVNKEWQKCETFFFLGEKDMISGDLAGAQKHFEDCVNTGVTNYYEYDMAKGELSRMQGMKSP
jgi:TolB-like protein/lipoprotein NlpI